MAGAVDTSGLGSRRLPRYATRHPVEGASLDGRVQFRGTLRELSAEGCQLQLDWEVPPGTSIQARCDISGIALRFRGETVWAKATSHGVFHGVQVTGFASEADALFHRLYVGRLARRRPGGTT